MHPNLKKVLIIVSSILIGLIILGLIIGLVLYFNDPKDIPPIIPPILSNENSIQPSPPRLDVFENIIELGKASPPTSVHTKNMQNVGVDNPSIINPNIILTPIIDSATSVPIISADSAPSIPIINIDPASSVPNISTDSAPNVNSIITFPKLAPNTPPVYKSPPISKAQSAYFDSLLNPSLLNSLSLNNTVSSFIPKPDYSNNLYYY